MSTRPAGNDPDAVRAMLKQAAASHLPAGSIIVREVLNELLQGHQADAAWIRANLSDLVVTAQSRAYETYLAYEARAGGWAMRAVFAQLSGQPASAEKLLGVLEENFKGLDLFMLGLSQGRRARAGAAFDLVVRELLGRLGYPFTGQALVAGRTDLLLPSSEHYRRNPLDTVILTLKRTLRERWKQVLTEGENALGVFLATIDPDVAARDIAQMMNHKIRLVVPRSLKEATTTYLRAPNVISFERFLTDHLDPAVERWRRAGVI